MAALLGGRAGASRAISSLPALRSEGSHGVALLDVDWEQVRRLEGEADELIDRGRRADAREVLRRALAQSDEQPKLLRKLTQVELALGERAAARDTLARFLALEPGDERMKILQARIASSAGAGSPGVH